MSANTGPIMNVVVELAEVQQLRVTVTESFKGALLAGSCAFAGGLIGGPIGLGVGGVIGACAAAVKGQGKYKSLAHVILYDMTDRQKEQLASNIQCALQRVRTEDIMLLLTMALRNGSLQALIMNEVKNFLLKELRMRLV